MALQIRRLGYALGAEVTGIDLAQPLDDATVAAIRRAWLDHLLLRFPKQELTATQLGAFAKRFGELELPPAYPHPDEPLVGILSSQAADNIVRRPYEDVPNWHSDQSFTTLPTALTILYSRELPPVGGDTMFANTYLGYEALSATMRGVVDRLSAIHDLPRHRIGDPTHPERYQTPTVHPLARIHPETNKPALYLGYRARRILGLSEEEGTPILDYLKRHAVRPEFTFRNAWSVDDVLLWDDRCTLHLALRDFDYRSGTRRMFRCAVVGTKCGTPYTEGLPFSA